MTDKSRMAKIIKVYMHSAVYIPYAWNDQSVKSYEIWLGVMGMMETLQIMGVEAVMDDMYKG